MRNIRLYVGAVVAAFAASALVFAHAPAPAPGGARQVGRRRRHR